MNAPVDDDNCGLGSVRGTVGKRSSTTTRGPYLAVLLHKFVELVEVGHVLGVIDLKK